MISHAAGTQAAPGTTRSEKATTPDLNALWDAHIAAEFASKDASESCDTMAPHATVNHVLTMTGGALPGSVRNESMPTPRSHF